VSLARRQAEFQVHLAVGSHAPRVEEWAGHDVETDDGLRIEAEAGACLRAWGQRAGAVSPIRFQGIRARTWLFARRAVHPVSFAGLNDRVRAVVSRPGAFGDGQAGAFVPWVRTNNLVR
jgi:hypothetical protein